MDQSRYETVIGLEVHVQLNTASKAFCADRNAFGGEPNTRTSAISLAHPGTLPRLNREQVEKAVRLGLALESTINHHSRFDRKHYFYADLPKGFQTTQDAAPICTGGTLGIRLAGGIKQVRIHHVHMEEDAGKSLHDQESGYSLIDLNRAGTPLLEVVTEPDLRSAEEVDAFMTAMRRLVRWLDISDGHMEQGSLRCDCNISLRPWGQETLGNRCEIKNLNSMRYARQAIAYEQARQARVLDGGGRVDQQTLLYDPERGTTSPMREKEEAHDYRYFPEPDLPPVRIEASQLAHWQASLPALPDQVFAQLQESHGLSAYDADQLSQDRQTAEYYLGLVGSDADLFKPAANLLINHILPGISTQDLALENFPLGFDQLRALLGLIEAGEVSHSMAMQRLWPALLRKPTSDPAQLASELGIIQQSDTEALEPLIEQILEAHPDKVKTYRNGKKGLLGFFMGQLMQASKGQADPAVASKLLKDMLERPT